MKPTSTHTPPADLGKSFKIQARWQRAGALGLQEPPWLPLGRDHLLSPRILSKIQPYLGHPLIPIFMNEGVTYPGTFSLCSWPRSLSLLLPCLCLLKFFWIPSLGILFGSLSPVLADESQEQPCSRRRLAFGSEDRGGSGFSP